ncbi:MAG: 2-C-methyl-D-erythritol 4-phosphate cytidylyltransferase [Firmicutes bacterium]|nr:2-C-methyl-D-erythritol 4-phosphate cytidylyltransferase [Bacillota bacterium]
MIFGVIVAGGIGSRMGAEIPKQYIEVGSKPIIIHTMLSFLRCKDVDKLIVLTPADWIDYTRELCDKHLDDPDKVCVISGGATRNDTVENALKFIDETYGLDEDTIVLTHDAVRPMVTERIIQDNIEAVRKHGACTTAIPATDTILEAEDGFARSIPDRSRLFNVQTPQSFWAKELKETYDSLSSEERLSLTDAAKIYVMRNKPVSIVDGEVYNIKITYPSDLVLAENMLQ